MENTIEMTQQELIEVEGGSWFAYALALVSPGAALFAIGIEHGIREASAE